MKWLVIAITVIVFSPFSLQSSAVADVGVSVVFSDDEIRIISVWYRDHASVADKKRDNSKRNGLPKPAYFLPTSRVFTGELERKPIVESSTRALSKRLAATPDSLSVVLSCSVAALNGT